MEKQRFLALDILRGATVCLMIIVNSSTGTGREPFSFLVHAPWIGFTAADLVFPTFLFAIGNAMAFGDPRADGETAYLARIGKRAVLLFLFGYLLYWYPFFRQAEDGSWAFWPFDQTRLTGVLQRIALAFLFAALAVRHLDRRMLVPLCAGLLLAHWAALAFGGAPGQELTKAGCACTRFDLWLVGPHHLYRKDGGFDPEGFLGVLPSIVNVLAGYLAGALLRARGNTARSVGELSAAGVTLIALALLWAPVLPIAKKIWTGSYATLSIGLDFVILAGLVYALEIRKLRAGIFFLQIFGKNPLALYLFSELLIYGLQFIPAGGGRHLYEQIADSLFLPLLPGPFGVLLFSSSVMLTCWLLGYLLHRRGLILKI